MALMVNTTETTSIRFENFKTWHLIGQEGSARLVPSGDGHITRGEMSVRQVPSREGQVSLSNCEPECMDVSRESRMKLTLTVPSTIPLQRT